MDCVEVPGNKIERCLYLFRLVGFSHAGKGTEREFEEHLRGNRKILSISGKVLVELGGLEFYDDPQAGKMIDPELIIGKRRFRWNQRNIYIYR